MESSPSLVFISFVMLALIYSPAAAAAGGGGSNGTTVFDVLPQFGLPAGLLPDAVASYSLDEDGGFTVELDRPSCYVQFDSNLVYYERRITGTLKIGSIRNLEGVQVQRLFLWLGVNEIKVDLPPSDYIYFQVGWISKRLSIEDFREVHSCQDRAAYRDQIGLLPEPQYEVNELITGDGHVPLHNQAAL